MILHGLGACMLAGVLCTADSRSWLGGEGLPGAC